MRADLQQKLAFLVMSPSVFVSMLIFLAEPDPGSDATSRRTCFPFTSALGERAMEVRLLMHGLLVSSILVFQLAAGVTAFCQQTSIRITTVYSEGLAPSTMNGKVGFVDMNQKWVISAQFDRALLFKEGKAGVRTNEKWGYIDKSGTLIINPQFDEVEDFSEGFAAVRIGDSWGFIDQKGTTVVNPIFESVGGFSEGLATVQVNNKTGYVDIRGKLVIPPEFGLAHKFEGGRACVCAASPVARPQDVVCFTINWRGERVSENCGDRSK